MSLIRIRGWFARKRWRKEAWIIPERLLLAAYPSDQELRHYHGEGVRVVVNLHKRAHDPAKLAEIGITEIHIPVRDFTAPTPGQLDQGVSAISHVIEAGQAALVHCLRGRGRAGTLAACYLVSQGTPVDAAIDQVRELRPGAIRTHQQEAAIETWSRLPGRAGTPSS
ncbi:MAG TPA: dual specificity protein phosphatase family protein [Thermomicrobiales bacterium]|nr:dual specificity protein phosphatase family protein [Thermomicrobiales bacterium]